LFGEKGREFVLNDSVLESRAAQGNLQSDDGILIPFSCDTISLEFLHPSIWCF